MTRRTPSGRPSPAGALTFLSRYLIIYRALGVGGDSTLPPARQTRWGRGTLSAPERRTVRRWAGWRAAAIAVTALATLGVVMVGASGAAGSSDAAKATRGGGLIEVGPDIYGGRLPFVRADGKVVNLKIKKKALNKAVRKRILR